MARAAWPRPLTSPDLEECTCCGALVGHTTAPEVERMLELLVKRVETGEPGGLIPFNTAGEAVQLA